MDNKALADIFVEHNRILKSKKILYKTYLDWYQMFLDYVSPLDGKKIVELGSGGGILKEIAPSVITTDVIPLPGCDLVCRAEKLPFENESVDAIFMLNTLHHIPDCNTFFKEAERALCNNGILYITEPANTIFSRFIYKNFHHEPFDLLQQDWIINSSNPLFDSNQALSWIIFHRDIDLYTSRFPKLSIEKKFCHTPLRYLLSGGYSVASFLPGWSYPLIVALEWILKPLNRFTSLFETVIIRKVNC